MFFWFIAAAVATVLFVFDSPAVDYRFVAFGGVVPLVEVLAGRPMVLHTLLGSVILLTGVMAATTGRRVLRRRLLGVPIGSFVFLVASTAWTTTDLFWWPVGGAPTLIDRPFPEFDRPLGWLILLELLGLAMLVGVSRRHGLSDPRMRAELIRTGRLARPSGAG